jgi:hypothetical protein
MIAIKLIFLKSEVLSKVKRDFFKFSTKEMKDNESELKKTFSYVRKRTTVVHSVFAFLFSLQFLGVS